MSDPSELVAMAKRIIDGNRYMTIATIDDDAHPWATPVYFGHGDYRDFYWISSPDAEHSRNIAARAAVSIVIFDSSVEIGAAEAVYMRGQAEEVSDPTSEDCNVAFRARFKGVRALSPAELRPPATLRLYRAHVVKHWVLIRGNDPVWGRGTDARLEVEL
jgi:nitroimidazol reductase NimA-like FMN-containing flavoprotein (pyridoxamine 5'-phosphate oxidase superfamily)